MTTRKRTPRTAKPASPPVDPIDDRDWEIKSLAITPLSVLMLMIFTSMLSITVFLLLDRYARPSVTPEPAPVVVPVNNLESFTAPIRAKLATDRSKAAKVADAYLGLSAAIAGNAGQRLTSSRIFEAAHGAFLTDLDAAGGVAVGAEIDQAIGSYLGMTKTTGADGGWEPITFDSSHRVKLVEITAAIAEAAGAVK
jgi:hypothetical protein